MPTESSPESELPDQTAVRRRIHDHAEAIRREELDRALTRYEAAGPVSATDRAALQELADRLTQAILAGPERVLEQDSIDEEALEAAMNLFGEES